MTSTRPSPPPCRRRWRSAPAPSSSGRWRSRSWWHVGLDVHDSVGGAGGLQRARRLLVWNPSGGRQRLGLVAALRALRPVVRRPPSRRESAAGNAAFSRSRPLTGCRVRNRLAFRRAPASKRRARPSGSEFLVRSVERPSDTERCGIRPRWRGESAHSGGPPLGTMACRRAHVPGARTSSGPTSSSGIGATSSGLANRPPGGHSVREGARTPRLGSRGTQTRKTRWSERRTNVPAGTRRAHSRRAAAGRGRSAFQPTSSWRPGRASATRASRAA